MAKDHKVALKVPDRLLPGVYANQVMVRHTREEFVLDFVNRFPPRTSVVARIVVSPGHLRRIIHALDDNLKRFESLRGSVTVDDTTAKIARHMAPAAGSQQPPRQSVESPPKDAPPEGNPSGAAGQQPTEQPSRQPQQQNVARVSEEIVAGVYSNQMVVSHSGEEFLLDFANVFPPDSIVTARVFVSPKLFKRMIGALKDNLSRYEAALRKAIRPNVPSPSDPYIN